MPAWALRSPSSEASAHHGLAEVAGVAGGNVGAQLGEVGRMGLAVEPADIEHELLVQGREGGRVGQSVAAPREP